MIIYSFFYFDCWTEKMEKKKKKKKGKEDARMIKYNDSYFTRFLHINCALCK
jgi:hypothetical protein